MRKRGPGRLAIFASLVIVGVCVLLAAPLFAFASRSTHGVVVAKEGSGSTSTTCPRGEHVAFGGVVAQFQAPPGSGPVVYPESARRTASGTWSVSGRSLANHIGSRLTAVAYCAHGLTAPIAEHASAVVGSGETAAAVAQCPTGTVVVAGGYVSSDANRHVELVTKLDLPAPNRFRAEVRNGGYTTTVTAFAYCGPGPAPTAVTTTITLAAHHGGVARVHCPDGTGIVLGGLVGLSPNASPAEPALVAPFSWTAASNTEWDVSGYNGGGQSGSLEAIAYCR